MVSVADILGRIEALRQEGEYRHEQNVSAVAAKIASLMGLENGHGTAVGAAALLHDIGKLVLADAVLYKPGHLSSPENEMTKMHSRLGHDILKDSRRRELKLAATIALRHHEYVDGSGYPDGLVGDEIPLEARIVTVADAYSALREPRVYKTVMSHGEALDVLTRGDDHLRPQQLDPDIMRTVLASSDEIDQAFSATH